MITFGRAIAEILDKEGGYVADPDDPGGETKYGISKRRYPEVDIKTLTTDHAMDLYHRDFWNPLYDRLIDQTIATKLLELTLHLPHGDRRPFYAGKMEGIRVVQQACRALGDQEIAIDGRFGPQTLQACRLERPEALLAAIRVEQTRYYLALADKSISLRKFLRGWLRRAVA